MSALIQQSELLTTGQAARLRGVDPVTIRRWIDAGKLRVIRPADAGGGRGRGALLLRADVQALREDASAAGRSTSAEELLAAQAQSAVAAFRRASEGRNSRAEIATAIAVASAVLSTWRDTAARAQGVTAAEVQLPPELEAVNSWVRSALAAYTG